MVHSIKERIQVNLNHPPIPLRDHRLGDPHSIMGAPARPEPVRDRHEPRIKHPGQDLRDCLLDQPIQRGRHPNIRSPPSGFGIIT